MSSVPSIDGTAPGSASEDDAERANNELRLLKPNNIFRVVEMAFELQYERLRAVEALKARDVAVQRLADAYKLLRQRAGLPDISQLNPFDGNANGSSKHSDVNYMGVAVKMLREESQTLNDKNTESPPNDDSPICDEIESEKNVSMNAPSRTTSDPKSDTTEPRIIYATPSSDEPSEMVHARYAVLAAMPLPPDAPADTLKPIVIPAPFTFNEFISSITGPLRNLLNDYRVLHGITTVWCPEREEHGYFYVPRFKCNTNPRVSTAHRWSQVDIVSHIKFFFNKDGTWYYAGVYKVFVMDDLTVKEWANLPPETTQAIIKDTLSGRKNTSPQNVYETGQLYTAGALKVACVGLQCVGFNQVMYKALLEHAGRFAQNKLKTLSVHNTVSTSRTHWSSCSAPKEMTEAIDKMSHDKAPSRN